MSTIGKAFVLVMAVGVVAALGVGQTATKPKFEVASIKRNTSGGGVLSLETSKGRFVATNLTVRLVLRYAYNADMPESELLRAPLIFGNAAGLQVIGGPSWVQTERFDIEAKPAGDHTISQSEMQLMVQSLFEDRFQLKAHREMREVPIYNLVVVKEGKMKASSDDGPSAAATPQGEKLPPPPPRGRLSTFVLGKPTTPLVMTMYGNAVPVSTLATTLESWAGRSIIDKTHLNGLFDVLLQFSPEQSSNTVVSPNAPQGAPPSDPSGPSIFTAIQQELGLKLEPSKGSAEVLVIDSVQRPSEN